MQYTQREDDRGFTLVELLIVIVILGILATITVFAVRGITDEGEQSACLADRKNIETAEEAQMAKQGSYIAEDALVTAGLLHSASGNVDVSIAPGGQSYTTSYVGPCIGVGTTAAGGPTTAAAPSGPAVPLVTSWNGFPASVYGSGPETVVVVGWGTAMADVSYAWAAFFPMYEPIAGVELVMVNTSAASAPTLAEVDTLISNSDRIIWMAGGTSTTSDTSQNAILLTQVALGGTNAVVVNPSSIPDYEYQLDQWFTLVAK